MKIDQSFRDLIYINGIDYDKHCFYSYGIEFYEFMKGLENRPNFLLLLKHKFDHAQWNQHTRFDYISNHEIDELMKDDIYGYGDFCWVDFKDITALNTLTNNEIAELLYFGHQSSPLNYIPMDQFAYYAHDDGWFNKVYVANLEDYMRVLSNVILYKLRRIIEEEIENFLHEITTLLLESTKYGLFIDFARVIHNKEGIKVPVTAIGNDMDMDQVYDIRYEIDSYRMWFVYADGKWTLIRED